MLSGVATLAGPYAEFGAIGGAALDMTAASHGVALSVEDRQRILPGMLSLPAHPDARDGLRLMREAGLRLVTLQRWAAVDSDKPDLACPISLSERVIWIVASRPDAR